MRVPRYWIVLFASSWIAVALSFAVLVLLVKNEMLQTVDGRSGFVAIGLFSLFPAALATLVASCVEPILRQIRIETPGGAAMLYLVGGLVVAFLTSALWKIFVAQQLVVGFGAPALAVLLPAGAMGGLLFYFIHARGRTSD